MHADIGVGAAAMLSSVCEGFDLLFEILLKLEMLRHARTDAWIARSRLSDLQLPGRGQICRTLEPQALNLSPPGSRVGSLGDPQRNHLITHPSPKLCCA